MTRTPEHGANEGDLHPQSQSTEPITPVARPSRSRPSRRPSRSARPGDAAAAGRARGAPDEPVHAAAPRGARRPARRVRGRPGVAAATAAAHAEAVRRAQWDAAQRASVQDPALVQQQVRQQQVAAPAYQVPLQVPAASSSTRRRAPTPVVPKQRKRRSWIPVTSAAAAAAIIAAVAAGGVVHSLSGDDASARRAPRLARHDRPGHQRHRPGVRLVVRQTPTGRPSRRPCRRRSSPSR